MQIITSWGWLPWLAAGWLPRLAGVLAGPASLQAHVWPVLITTNGPAGPHRPTGAPPGREQGGGRQPAVSAGPRSLESNTILEWKTIIVLVHY